jgi:hypothetical protein
VVPNFSAKRIWGALTTELLTDDQRSLERQAGQKLAVIPRGIYERTSIHSVMNPTSFTQTKMSLLLHAGLAEQGAHLLHLRMDLGNPSETDLDALIESARSASSRGGSLRLALASACQRLTVEQRKPIVLALLAHEEDKDDPNLPLIDWYAADPAWAAEALAACKIPKVAEFIARRLSEK